MATLVLNYNIRNLIATKTIDYILSLGVFTVKKPHKLSGIDIAMKEVKAGKVTRLKNTENPLAEILK